MSPSCHIIISRLTDLALCLNMKTHQKASILPGPRMTQNHLAIFKYCHFSKGALIIINGFIKSPNYHSDVLAGLGLGSINIWKLIPFLTNFQFSGTSDSSSDSGINVRDCGQHYNGPNHQRLVLTTNRRIGGLHCYHHLFRFGYVITDIIVFLSLYFAYYLFI